MRKRKIIATGGLLTTLLLTNSHKTLAETVPVPSSLSHTSEQEAETEVWLEHELGQGPTLDTIAVDWDIDVSEFKEELKGGKTPKHILAEQGFSPSQIKKIFKNT